MWRWRVELVVAFAICVAAIACPRTLWDRLRVPLVAAAERAPGAAGAGGAAAPASDPQDLALVRAELHRTEAERAELARVLAEANALLAAVPSIEPRSALPVRVFGAEAAAGGASARAGRVRLDRGARSGVRLQAPLVSGAAIAGRVVAVSEDVAEVELVTAPTFRAWTQVVRTGQDGMVRGAGAAGLRFRPKAAEPDLKPGDAVVVSTHSAYAPGGLVLGTVTAVERDRTSGLIEAVLEPAADLGGLLDGFVLLRGGSNGAAAASGAGGAP